MPDIARLSTREPDFARRLAALTAFDAAQDEAIDRAAAAIVADVRARGDAAVLELSQRFDRIRARRVAELEILRGELDAAASGLAAGVREALAPEALGVDAFLGVPRGDCA